MDDTIDLLKIKIEKAKRELPLETINAINTIDWRAVILGLRVKKGYTFEQLGDLELETELLLCGLVTPQDYPKELENRMEISRAAANELVNEMNELVFKKIREELIKNTERKKIFAKNSPLEEYPAPVSLKTGAGGGGESTPVFGHPSRGEFPPRSDLNRSTPQEGNKSDTAILSGAGIEIIPAEIEGPKKIETPTQTPTKVGAEVKEIHPLLEQKLASSFQIGVVKTEHSLDNITKSAPGPVSAKPKIPNADPYRELPE